MEAQLIEKIEKAKGISLYNNDRVNVRILSHKEIEYTYGVIINTLCIDLKNDTIKVREELYFMLKDFVININKNLDIFCKIDDGAYEAWIEIRNETMRFSNKVFSRYDKADRAFTNLKVRCAIDDLKKVVELKKYLEIKDKKNG